MNRRFIATNAPAPKGVAAFARASEQMWLVTLHACGVAGARSPGEGDAASP